MLKMYGFWRSAASFRVRIAMNLKGLSHDDTYLHLEKGDQFDPAYKALNPNSRVPTIEDGDFVLWESNSIMRYFCMKYGGEALYPADPATRADIDRWLDWSLSILVPVESPLFLGTVRTPPEKRDMAVITKAAVDAGKLWARLDEKLAGKLYVAGQHFTMGDIPVGCFVHRWYALDIERPALKNLRAWYDRLATRPAYAKHIMVKLT